MSDNHETPKVTKSPKIRKCKVISILKNIFHSIQTKPKSMVFISDTVLTIVLAMVFMVSGILLFEFNLFTTLMRMRMLMTPGLPPYDLWKQVSPKIYCKVYLFNVTNHVSFLNGTDKKMQVEEIGPIIYREHLEHNDVVFHENNSTLSYTAKRYLEFIPELNEPGILNRTVIVPNIVLLGMATRVAHAFTFKIPFNLLSTKDKVFRTMTIQDYFWNFTTPALDTVKSYASFLLPLDNGGALHTIYMSNNDRYNVNIGPKTSFEQFFRINRMNGRTTVPGYKPEKGDCNATLVNSTEGAIYSNMMDHNSVVVYWRKAVCRPIPLHFHNEVEIDSMNAFKFQTSDDWYDRLEDPEEDCYKGKDSDLPNGLSDASKCYGDLPVAMSSPHFFGRNGRWDEQFIGFKPNETRHRSYAIIDPISGISLDQRARSQSNMVMPTLVGFREEINRFSKFVVPLVWIEYHMPKLTPEILSLMYFGANVLPVLAYVLPVLFVFLGILCSYFAIIRLSPNLLKNYSKYWTKEKSYYMGKAKPQNRGKL
ncbi:SCRB7.2 family protein [Megaselia abdita]